MSNIFSVSNGAKQGGVLPPIIFAVHTDGLLKGLQEIGITWVIAVAVLLPMLMTSLCYLQVTLDYLP